MYYSSYFAPDPSVVPLLAYPALTLRQGFETPEMFGFETANRYSILDPSGQPILVARERQGGFWGQVGRQLAGHAMNAFTVDVLDNRGNAVLTLSHPARYWRQKIAVWSGTGRPLGEIEQVFTFFDKQLVVRNTQGSPLLRMDSGLFQWNMPLVSAMYQRPGIAARIVKRADALGILTDVDTYRIEFDPSLEADLRALVIATALFIDFTFFERRAH